MPDTETVATTETPSFAEHRSAMIKGDRPKIELLDRTAISRDNDNSSPDDESESRAASETAKGQQKTKVEKRQGEIDRDIASRLERARIAGEKADAEEARLAKLQKFDVKAAPIQEPGLAAPAYDGSDKSDPRPERPKKPDENAYKDWASYQTEKQKYDESMEEFQTANAAWTARAEWRKADKLKQETAARDSATAQVNKDLSEFEATAKDWAKSEKIEDFFSLFAEIKKRPVLSNETGLVTMYGGEAGARLLYELMTHPDKLEEIEAMPPGIKRLNALYELMYSLRPTEKEERKPAQEKPRSAAPAPGTRVSGGGQGSASKEPKSFRDYQTKRFGT